MNYPKQVMRLSELKKMGFTDKWLREAFRLQGTKKIAWKMGTAENSPILFDTGELEKYRRAQCVGR